MFKKLIAVLLIVLFVTPIFAQNSWTPDGSGFYYSQQGEIKRNNVASGKAETVVHAEELTPKGAEKSLPIKDFAFSENELKVLIFTNSQKVWRYETRGDYWVLDRKTKKLQQLGKTLPEATLMFAKLSPNGKQAAYVSKHNIYLEDLATGKIQQLTSSNNTPKLINGTFDWAYEEEFSCLDGFRWSPDGKRIAYWQIDANTIRDFYMVNTTDSIYAQIVPVEYPKVGESPSACRVGVIEVATGKTTWMKVPGDNRQHYIPRMEWANNSEELILQQLNRKQNHSKLMYANAVTGEAKPFYEEKEEAWISVRSKWSGGNGWSWLEKEDAFLWVTEKDGWRHCYKVSRDGKKEKLITKGNFDLISPKLIDEANGYVYYMASPDNATESYLYRSKLNGKGKAERVTPDNQQGTHDYTMSPNGKYAYHNFSNYFTRNMAEWISLKDHKALDDEKSIAKKYDASMAKESNVSFFTVKTEDGVEMDGWMAKPYDFDPSKKYPTVFYVYSEPAGATVKNRYGTGRNRLYNGDMAEDGYIYISLDGRGTPAPKGKAWRKAIYRKIGIVNIRDQAMGCKKLIETHSYIDADRIAVHGWSGGGSATLNLLFQYPDLYQTGIAVAAVANQLSYDNIYQERYMGIPQENLQDFIDGSPITYAKNLKGNLLYIHGTGDDNVHYQNAEMLVNELIKHNKIFQFMPYPNRAHGIYRGEGTRQHLNNLFTTYLKQHCPPGAK